jgi:molecular chaperone GrpE
VNNLQAEEGNNMGNIPETGHDEIPVIIKDNNNGLNNCSCGKNSAEKKCGGNGKKKEPSQSLPEGTIDPVKTTEKSNTQEQASCENNLPEVVEMSKDDKIRELEEQIRRLSAEFENFRRRQEKRYEETCKYAAEDTISKFLPVLDSIEQARIMTRKDCDMENYLKGLDLIYSQLSDALIKLGVEEIKSVGEAFDPAIHHAAFVHETDEHPEDTVLEEFQKGYTFRDRVLRPSMVKVSKKS